jgi:hypothetical protein
MSGKYLELAVDLLTGLGVTVAGELEANTLRYTAGEAISGDHIVAAGTDGLVYLADAATAAAGRILGISREGVIAGSTIRVLREGLVTRLVGLVPGDAYFLGSAGAITNVPPVAGLLQQIGTALTPSTLFVHISQPIIRN